mmetsp:Transcript_26820/g.88008  ORF Transcript_26820/g.88008 Transcript_26820/m.88008 type:complete len:381 (+) Transcript_26820:370-1512(+)
MKLVKRAFDKGGAGYLKVIPTEPEDMWILYNIVRQGDRATATTVRKVQRETGGGERSESERVKLTICVEVEAIEYDAEGASLRLRGRNLTESDHIKLGAYHTLEVELHRAVTIEKEEWDSMDLERVEEASDPAASADLAAVVMQEGLAHLCLVGNAQTLMRARVEVSMPRKHGPAVMGYDKAVGKFFERVMQAIVQHVRWDVVKCVVLAGPGFTKDSFYEWLMLEATRRDERTLIENKAKFLGGVHASSGHKHALKEVLADAGVMTRIKDTKALAEVRALDAFYAMLSSEPERAFYGPGHVRAAHELGAVQTLLLTDSVFRNADPNERRKMVALADEVRDAGGVVHVFSSMHVSGEQLALLSGMAAILRFPLPDLADAEL